MRMPNEDEDLIGKVCVCSVGRPFIVTGKCNITTGSGAKVSNIIRGWCGLGLDGKGTAFSTNPCIIEESGQEFHNKLRDRFGGKMSYNG